MYRIPAMHFCRIAYFALGIYQTNKHLSHEPNAIGAPILCWPQASSAWLFAVGAIAEAVVGRR